MKAAQYWADYLKTRGVRRIFGLPGTESLELVEATRQAGLDFVLTHHEATAAFAAAMHGHLTRIPGVCLATRGPGAMNLVSGVAAAHLDRMPLLAVTGDHAERPDLPSHQRLPLADFFAPITRASLRVSADSLPDQLPHLFDAAVGHEDHPGPAFMAFPAPETGKEIDAVSPIADVRPNDGTKRIVPDLAPILDAVAWARRPMIIAGLGIPTAAAGRELIELAERLQCPVADTPQMKGWFPNDHSLYAGTFGTHRDQAVTDLANRSDLILTIGLDSVEFLKPWQLTTPVMSLSTTVAGEPAIPAQAAINGPLVEMLQVLATEARPAGAWPPGTAQRCRQETVDGLVPPRSDDGRGVLWPQTVVSELQRAMPPEGIVTVDVGSHKLLMVLQWRACRPNGFLNSSGISSMGSGIPFALAAKLAFPDRPVTAVIGDGGYLMYTGELATLARLNLPILIVVMADAALYSIKIKQLRRSYPPVGTDFTPVAVADIARGFGLTGTRVTNRAECRQALVEGLCADRPTVVEAVIDPAAYDCSQ